MLSMSEWQGPPPEVQSAKKLEIVTASAVAEVAARTVIQLETSALPAVIAGFVASVVYVLAVIIARRMAFGPAIEVEAGFVIDLTSVVASVFRLFLQLELLCS